MTQTTSIPARPMWRDYLELSKPNVVALMIVTSAIGMVLSTPGFIPLDVFVLGNLGIALSAGSAAAVNHLVDQRIDTKMARTQNRPVATGRLTTTQGVLFALITGGLGMGILFVFINALTAWLTFASLLGYAVVYTLYLKRATPQNIVIGGLAGAAPPLLGWVAVTGEIHPHALLLVLVIYIWTPPHFWALAIHRRDDYAKADIPMLPVTHGIPYTKLHVLLYTVILLLVTLLPWLTGMFGLLYLAAAVLLGAGFLCWSLILYFDKHPNAGMETFKYSILYLLVLFVAMILDHYLMTPTFSIQATGALV